MFFGVFARIFEMRQKRWLFNERVDVMRSEPHLESATIYQFPVGGRAGFKGMRNAVVTTVPSMTSPKTHIDFDSWYHQQAIVDGDKDKPHN